MLRKVLHSIATNYALAMFWVYLVAFGLAFLSIFVFPLFALLMVIAAVCSLIPVFLVGRILQASDRAATRPMLRKGICPNCKQPSAVALGPGELTCVGCGSRYAVDGEELEGAETPAADVPAAEAPRDQTATE